MHDLLKMDTWIIWNNGMHPCLWWHEMHIFQGHSIHHCRCLWIYIRVAWHDWYARFQRAGTVCSGMVRMICSFPKPHMYSFILITVNWPTCTYFPSFRLWYLISLQKKSQVGDASTVWNLFFVLLSCKLMNSYICLIWNGWYNFLSTVYHACYV